MNSDKQLEEKAFPFLNPQSPNKPEIQTSLSSEDAHRLLKELKLKEIELELKINELNNSNTALNEKLNVYHDFFELSDQAQLIVDRSFNIIDANPKCSLLLNKTVQELKEDNFRNYFDGEWKGGPVKIKSQREEELDVRAEIKPSSNESRYYITLHPYYGFASEEITIHEQLYRAIGESINYGIWVCLPDGRNIYASDSFLELIGITQKQCSDFGWGNYLHPEDRERTINAWKKCVETGDVWDIEHRYTGTDNKWHHILARGVPVKNEKGDIIYWAGINLDITELKNTQLSLKESEEKYKVLLESMPIGLAISDLSGKIIYGNKKSRSLLEISRAELKQGIDISRWKFVRKEGSEVTPVEMPDIKKYYKHKVNENTEIGIVKEDNRITWLNLTTAPLPNSNEILVAFIDISEKVERENQLKSLSEKLKELNATKDKFFSIIAHDLKNPFNSILGFSELMIKNVSKYSAPEIERFIGIIHSTSKNAYNLLENLLNWSRSQTGTIEFIPGLYDLNDIISANIELVKNYALKKNIRIIFEPVGKCYVEIDKNMLDTVLRNLLTNSIKFSFPGEKVVVSVESFEENYRICIKDYGIGIEKENLEKLFRIDSKYSSYGTNQEKGSGLGLIISKEFIERNKGKIWVNSEFGKGSEFYITLHKAEEWKP